MDNLVTSNSKRITAGNVAILIALFVLTFGCWNEIAWYNVMAPLGTVVSFIALAIAVLCYVNIKAALKDSESWVVVIGIVLAFINIIVVKSGIGALFTAADLLLILYLADKMVMPRKWIICVGIYIGFFYYYWTFDVKGYFKGYNTNYGGLVLITGFVFAMTMLVMLLDYLKARKNTKLYYIVAAFFLFMFAWGYNIISWYRARCALLGLVIVAIFILVPFKLWTGKILYPVITYGITLGAIVISGIYILLGKIKDVFTIQIFYKDILSGRDEIWTELWTAYLKKPLTGIGSSYKMKLAWMDGMFEVHNGLLDILIVHGIFVFLIVWYLLVKKMLMLRKDVSSSKIAATAFAGMLAILGSSFMENFFIVPPFSICFLILFVIIRQHEQFTNKLESKEY